MFIGNGVCFWIMTFLFTAGSRENFMLRAGPNPYKSFLGSSDQTRQRRVNAVCKSRKTDISLGEKILTLGVEKVIESVCREHLHCPRPKAKVGERK